MAKMAKKWTKNWKMATVKLGGSKSMAVLLPALSGKSIWLKMAKMALNGNFLPEMAYQSLN